MKKTLLFVAALIISAFAWADNKTETVGETQIKAQNKSAHKYADDPISFNGTALQYEFCGMANKDMPWFQLRDNADPAYIKIKAPGKIISVKLTVTSASNASGGQADITKHNPYDTSKGKMMLRTALDATDTLVASNAVSNNEVTLTVPSGENKNLYLQTAGVGCRIWGWTVTYEDNGGSIDVKPVESVALDVTEKTMAVFETLQLTATITPADADNKKVAWTSSDENVATVSEKGFVRAIAVGTATITVTTEDGNKTATCAVTVEPAKKSDFVKIAPNTLKTGDEVVITMTVDSVGVPMLLSSEMGTKGPNAVEGGILEGTIVPVADEVVFVATVANDSITFAPKGGAEGVILYTTNDNAGVRVAKPAANAQGGFKWAYDEETGYLSTTYLYIKNKGKEGEETITVTRYLGVYEGMFHAYERTAKMIEDGKMPTNIKAETLAMFVKGATPIAVTGVTLNKSEESLEIGKTLQLVATVEPADAANKDVTWSSSDDAVATVSATGLVTAVAEGEAIITVKTVDGEKTATCKVTVTAPQAIENIEVSETATKIFHDGQLFIIREGIIYNVQGARVK
jgi:uncharacterized protein YjdB